MMGMWGAACTVFCKPFVTALLANNACTTCTRQQFFYLPGSNFGLLGSYGTAAMLLFMAIMGFWRSGALLMLKHHQGNIPYCAPKKIEAPEQPLLTAQILKREDAHIATIRKWEGRVVGSLSRLFNAIAIGAIFGSCGVTADMILAKQSDGVHELTNFAGVVNLNSGVLHLVEIVFLGAIGGGIARAVDGRNKRRAQIAFTWTLFLLCTGLALWFVAQLARIIPVAEKQFPPLLGLVGGVAGAVFGGRSILERRRADEVAADKVAEDNKKYDEVFQEMKQAGGAALLADINKVKLSTHFTSSHAHSLCIFPPTLQPNSAPP
jgi:hypothetical protein